MLRAKQGGKGARNERRKQDRERQANTTEEKKRNMASESVSNDSPVSGFSDPLRKFVAFDQLCACHLSIPGSVHRIVNPSIVFVACAGAFVERTHHVALT